MGEKVPSEEDREPDGPHGVWIKHVDGREKPRFRNNTRFARTHITKDEGELFSGRERI